jgi:cell division protein FtsI (penicillin-binding protein 3)
MHHDLAFKPPGSILAGEKLENPSRLRAKLCLYLLLAGFAGIAIKLVAIQIYEHDFWTNYVDDQRKSAIEIQPRRGSIYDHTGVPLATSLTQEVLCVVPSLAKDSVALSKALSPYAGMTAGKIADKIKKTKLHLIYLRRGLSMQTREEIEALSQDGVEFRSESSRRYPKASLASNLIGFSNVDNEGQEGIEFKFNSLLRGKPGKKIIIWDSTRREMPALAQTIVEVQDGSHIYLTIDETIQYSTEKALDEIVSKYSPESATAVVIDPKTGQLLAMAGRPTFNPNESSTFQTEKLRNRAVADAFEPGSAFKPIAAAVALERGIITPEDRVFCEFGYMRYHGHTFHDVHPFGEITFAEVMAESSNIGMIKVVSMLEPEALYGCIKDFGFGAVTGIDLPGESTGIVHPPSTWSGLSMGSLPIGQEISVTAIQLAAAYSAIANKGRMMRPYIISKTLDPEGNIERRNTPRFVRQVIRPETAEMLTKMLEGVVEYGTGTEAGIEGYRIAGKTGTAQKPNLEAGGYYRDKYVAVFAGFVPADDPVACIVVAVDSPRGKHYGGQVSAPAFREIANDILKYREIPPNAPLEQSSPESNGSLASTPGRRDGVGELIVVDDDGSFKMPDVRGKTMRVIAGSPLARLAPLEFEGSGVAFRQTPSPGRRIEKGGRIQIAFKRIDTK